jgi:hypothetical protein
MSDPPNTFSLMKITPLSGRTGFQLTPFSKRGMSHSLQSGHRPRSQARSLGETIREDVNGNIMNLTSTQFRNTRSKSNARIRTLPLSMAAWLGQIVEFESAHRAELPYWRITSEELSSPAHRERQTASRITGPC